MNVFKRAKIISLIFAAIFFFYFTNDFNIINIEKTALIVALGIDKHNNGYEITAQIAIPQASDSAQGNSESVISAKSETLYSAIEKISEETGWYPRLSFCNLVIIGENLLGENLINITDFFLRSYKMEDSAILCVAEGSAKDVLLASSPLDNISSFALTKIFVREFDNASTVMTSTIKDFAINGYSRSKFGYLPLVKKVTTEDKTDVKPSASVIATSTGEGAGGSAESDGGTTGGDEKDNSPNVFDATTTLLFNNGYYVGKLEKTPSLFYSLISKNVSEAYFPIEATDNAGNSGNFLVSVTKVKNNLELKFSGDKPIIKGNLELWLKIVDSNAPQDIKDYSNLGRLNGCMLYKAEEYASRHLYLLFEEIKNSGSDMFETINRLYRRFPQKYDEYSSVIKETVGAEFTVKCHNYS